MVEGSAGSEVFLINVPIGIIVLAGAFRYLPESRADDRTRLNLRGAVLLTGGLAAAIFCAQSIGGGGNGWGSGRRWGYLR